MLTGRQQERYGSKSARRKTLKSPFKIRDKIRQLEEKLEKEAMYKGLLKKHKPIAQDLPTISKHSPQLPSPESFSPKKTQQKNGNSVGKHSTTNRLSSSKLTNTPKQREQSIERQNSHPRRTPLFRKASQNDNLSRRHKIHTDSGENLQQLTKDNEKYKQIYSESLQKMERLEKTLKQIKVQHQSEKHQLQQKIQSLRKKIEEKKISLGHIYTYDEKGNNFLVVHDKIITQTDNENSSSNAEVASKKLRNSPEFSKLSVESK